ncbi:MAG: SigE family RNA polymerase sigma factor [Acidimicrobiales bacterium]
MEDFVPPSADDAAASFDDYFRASKKPLLAMAYMITGDIQVAQDLTQEAFLRTWIRWPRVRNYDDPRAWTRKVLRNLIISKSRSDTVRRSPVGSPGNAPPPDETHVMLAAALRSLPENQMMAIVLHDGAGMSIPEVALAMKVPDGTVKSWLSRGRATAALSLDASLSTGGR